jgi:hypothetical protein
MRRIEGERTTVSQTASPHVPPGSSQPRTDHSLSTFLITALTGAPPPPPSGTSSPDSPDLASEGESNVLPEDDMV